MPFIGRLIDNVDLGLGMSWAPFNTFEDVRKREIVVGATGGASPGYLVPAALLAHAGARFKIVSGYGGSNAVLLAVERKEVDLVGSIGMPGILQRNRDWITEGKAKVLYQVALKAHPLLPNVPTLPSLGLDEAGKAVLTAIAASSDIGRAIVATPGVPAERLAALRKAFQTMVADPEFLAVMQKRGVLIGAAPGEELDTIARTVVKTPRAVLDRIQALVDSAKK
jgi:tripartite-type tricarboxylate transporter receptor subunit TctC